MKDKIVIFTNVLTWIILLPVIGALAVLTTPKSVARWLALIFSAATFVLSMALFFQIAVNGYNFGNLQDLQYPIQIPWINFTAGSIQIKIDYFLGIDGLSLPMVILNALLTMLAVIGSWEKTRVKEYLALLLILEAGVMGVFMAIDLFLFFLFWEVELAPMFLLIGIWGSETIKHGMPGRSCSTPSLAASSCLSVSWCSTSPISTTVVQRQPAWCISQNICSTGLSISRSQA